MVFIEYALNGDKSYAKLFDGGLSSTDRAFGIAVDEQDYIYVTGYSITDASNTEDFMLIKYNSQGVQQWSKPLNGEGNQSDRAFGIAVDEQDGIILITGYSDNLDGNNDYLTAAYSTDGDLLWQQYYNGLASQDDEASAIGIITNSDYTRSVIVTGSSKGTNETFDYVTLWYDLNSGNIQDTAIYSMNSNSEDIAKDLAVNDDNDAFVTGFSMILGIGDSPSSSIISTIKLPKLVTGKTVQNNVPSSLTLYQNYPNPFNPSTIIKFTLGEELKTKLTVYDVMGREVTVLVNGTLKQGTYSITYTTQGLSSGIYFYEIRAGSKREVRKMTFIK
jgi:hypothetical protein